MQKQTIRYIVQEIVRKQISCKMRQIHLLSFRQFFVH